MKRDEVGFGDMDNTGSNHIYATASWFTISTADPSCRIVIIHGLKLRRRLRAMTGKKGKSGGARVGSGRPRRPLTRRKVQFSLSLKACELLHRIPAGERSKWLEAIIFERF